MKRAMILAAGRGERMGSLTSLIPKPLLHVCGKYLITYAIENLKQAGIEEIVINISYRGSQIKAVLGDGSAFGVKLHYAEEAERLETGGGILHALPLLGKDPFIVMSSDIITNFPFASLPQKLDDLAHLVLVENPDYHPAGDYVLKDGRISISDDEDAFTYASIGVFHPKLFAKREPGHFRLTEVLNPAIRAGKVSGEYFQGKWYNIGTPLDLEIANTCLN